MMMMTAKNDDETSLGLSLLIVWCTVNRRQHSSRNELL